MPRRLGLVLAALLAMVTMCFAPGEVFAATGDDHLIITTNGGTVLEATRLASGAWSGFSPVPGVPGQARAADEVVIGGQRNLVVLTTTGLYHTVKSASGWAPYTDLVAAGAGQPDIQFVLGAGGVGGRVSAANAGGVLHVVLTGIGQATHTFRNADGSWAPFNTGPLSQQRGTIRNADAVGLANGQLHIGVSTFSSSGAVFHAVRETSGTWSALSAVPNPSGGSTFQGFVSVAAVGDQVHLVVATQDTNRLYAAIRFPGGSWAGLADVTAQTGATGGGPIAATADSSGGVHIAIIGYTNGRGPVYSVRTAAGQWTPLADVKALAGDPGPSQWVGLSSE